MEVNEVKTKEREKTPEASATKPQQSGKVKGHRRSAQKLGRCSELCWKVLFLAVNRD